SEPGGAGSRIGRELGGVRLDRLAAEEEKRGPVSAGAVGLLGRTYTILCCDVECVLDKSVLKRVERDDPKTPTGPECVNGCLQSSLEALELVVHRDAQRLKRARGRVYVLRPEAPRHRRFDDAAQVLGAGDRLPRAGPSD